VEDDPKPTKRHDHNPSTREKISEGQKRLWADPEYRKRQSEAIRGALTNPGEAQLRAKVKHNQNMKRRWADPEYAKHMSQATRRSWENSAVRKGRVEGIKRSWADPERHKRTSAAIKRSLAKPEVVQRISEASKRKWADPEIHERMSVAIKKSLSRPEVRQQRSESMKRVCADPGWRRRRSESQKLIYASNPELPRKLLVAKARMEAERNAILRAAWRPSDWDVKPIEWRIIGTELLLSTDYISNKDLGKRLDTSRLLTCPYGSSWEKAFSSDKKEKHKGAFNFISDIRRWVGRSGKNPAAKSSSILLSVPA